MRANPARCAAVRKLATFTAGFAAAVFLAHYFVPTSRYLTAACICAGLYLLSAFFLVHEKKRVLIITAAAAIGFAACAANLYFKQEPANAFAGQTADVEAVVTEYPDVYDDYCAVTVRLTGDAPHVRTLAYGDFSEVVPGDVVRFYAYFKYSAERYGKPWDGYTSDGVYLVAYSEGTAEIIGRSKTAFLYYPQTVAKNLAGVISQLLPDSSGAFIQALLLGDKTGLFEQPQIYCDLADAGILHVVAVSGMHVAFLLGFLRLILKRRQTVSLIGIPIIWFFAFMAGATPSILRACFMQTLVLIAPLFNRRSDSLTSLSAALLVLLVINPDSCASVSLQLSFGAMLGMILITGRLNRALLSRLRNTGLHSITVMPLRLITATLSSSVGAMVVTVPLMALHFGYFSLYSVLENILVFWAVSAAFILGALSAIFGFVWLPLGIPFSWCAAVLSRFIMGTAHFFADLPYSIICTQSNVFSWAIAAIYAFFIAWLLFRRHGKISAVYPACAAVCVLCGAIIFTEFSAANSGASVTAVNVGQGQSIVITDAGAAVVVDCGGRSTTRNAGDVTAMTLLSSGRRSIDILALTHFDLDHINGVIRLMCRINVDNLVMPDVDCGERDEIVSFAEKQGTEVYIISEDSTFTVGSLELTVFEPVSKTKPTLIFLASHQNCDILITGDVDEEIEKRLLLRCELPDTEIFIAGHHGSKHSNCAQLLAAARAETAIVSCGYNTYGHPAPETLSRLDAAGMTVLRTDELGSITLDLEN